MARGKTNSLFINDPEIIAWLQKIEQIKKEISGIGLVRKGSIFQRWHVCGTPGCKCKNGKEFRHGPYCAWTSKENAKTVTIIVPNTLLAEAKDCVANAAILQEKVKQWTALSEKIVRRKIVLLRINS